ncbi:MAG: 2,3-bisphosphoglycerate-independent phosphoglycerate mutase [Candidatus Doudnabacteria bacterium]|nr:2,3-bisphosphoglycerate-independent phosphoglycerate mutase [Candidatus Doudnabacteria bacterium]
MTVQFKKALLVVLDGFGVASASHGNAVTRAKMNAFNSLVNHFPSITLQAAGPNVGLPWGEPGNSEVGHMCLGAGRIVLEDLSRIDRSISSGEFYRNAAFKKALDHVEKNGSTLHLLGLLSDGRVHSSQLHLYSLLILAAARNLKKVVIHVIADGRDTEPNMAASFISALEKKIVELGVGKIVSLCGRFYAMDRAQHWDLTEAAFRCIAYGAGETVGGALQAIANYYEQSIFDETFPPTSIVASNEKPVQIGAGDAVIFFNFRSDRAIQLTRALVDPASAPFSQKYSNIPDLLVVTMSEYSRQLSVEVAFPKPALVNSLSETLSARGKRQYHVAESEKYPHVTYFFDNGREEPLSGEEWDQVSSSSSYQERYQNVPQMSAGELTQRMLKKLSEPYDFYLVNYANPDMVGHTGSLSASIVAAETVDSCLETLVKFALQSGDLAVFVTADHGNLESVTDVHTGRIHKAHSTNPVPLILAGAGLKLRRPRESGYQYLATQIPEGLLSDVAPTILEIMGLSKAPEMTGISLMPNLLKQVIDN